MKILSKSLSIILLFVTASVFAGEADVIAVKTTINKDHSYHFAVTIRHKDEGWSHYVNKWEVVAPNGDVIATRVLYHPHVNEQPFTRSLYKVKIPSNIKQVTIRAYDSVHHYGGLEKNVTL